MSVFILDKHQRPLMPCHPARARELLRTGRAVVHRRVPFTIRLVDRLVEDSALQPVVLGIDPGSRTTGLALAREDAGSGVGPVRHALWLGQLAHRGSAIRQALQQRAGHRRRRRSAHLRHRAPRFANRRQAAGQLPPSLRHRLETVLAWVGRLRRWVPVSRIAVERVRFDTQLLEHPSIGGVEYQRGTLAGYELREYLLEKWGRQCVYCGRVDVALQVEHVRPKAHGGSSRASNLVLACEVCNQAKGSRPVEAFLANKPQTLARILAGLQRPLADAAAVNATRWALWRALAATGLRVEAASGGRTKWNRARLGVPKMHALDALCVGEVAAVQDWRRPVLAITATGRGSHQRTRLDRHGFPRGYLTRRKTHFGFRTGDLVLAVVPSGKHRGTHIGRVAVRASGSFNLSTPTGLRQGIAYRHCRLLQRADGYGYAWAEQPCIAGAVLPTIVPPPATVGGLQIVSYR
jgi:5-methylcytosine-specific restriction endonuclease McrA